MAAKFIPGAVSKKKLNFEIIWIQIQMNTYIFVHMTCFVVYTKNPATVHGTEMEVKACVDKGSPVQLG